jgi:chromosomal replication initiator protein
MIEELIKKLTAEHFGVAVESLSEKTRKKEIVVARQSAMVMFNEYTEMSLKSIGACFGGRDHSTVIHALRAIEDYEFTSLLFRTTLFELRLKVNHAVKCVSSYEAEKVDKLYEELLP